MVRRIKCNNMQLSIVVEARDKTSTKLLLNVYYMRCESKILLKICNTNEKEKAVLHGDVHFKLCMRTNDSCSDWQIKQA